MKGLELKIHPPIVMLLAGGMMHALARVGPVAEPWPGRGLLVVGLIVAGVASGVLGVLSFIRHRTTIHPHAPQQTAVLVTDGIYRFSRNPMYLGMLLLLLAWAAWLSSLPALLLGPTLYVGFLTRYQIMPEERMLRARFGDAYVRYAARVRRWL